MTMKGNDDQGKIDLLVFGYACKLFRDDEKAIMIDSGSHLIPWMGDESLKIDRYDGRGALYDLTSHEPKTAYAQVTDEDEAIEQLCDKERYRSLYINEEEELFYHEELSKRTQKKEQEYSEVSYNYDVPNYPGDEANIDVQGKPFVPPLELKIPPDMKIPSTVKHNAILERTALFLAQQGPQMEILMKVKQQGNKSFDFLSHTDDLHRYYLHLKSLIKSGSYVPKEQYFDDEMASVQSDDHYLHPSLVAKNSTPPPQSQDDSNPPDHIQKIIAKMIKYVIKNGNRFEGAIMKRGDVRFSFLNPKNQYHSFYKEELKKQTTKSTSQPPKVTVEPKAEVRKVEETGRTLKRKPVPVCFSIKKPKESEGLEVSSALPVEESSEEDESGSGANSPRQKSEPEVLDTSLEKRARQSPESTKKPKESTKDLHLQNERKIKVAQFLKGLKKK